MKGQVNTMRLAEEGIAMVSDVKKISDAFKSEHAGFRILSFNFWLWIILISGEPDLIDALVAWLGNH